jgi:uncharacterized caspase-like protein
LAQSRNALVIGNGAYQSVPALKTPATDAAIVAETLQAAGYDVTQLHDVLQADIGQIMRDFLDKIAAGEPGGIAFVYYSGHAARSKGENFLLPVDAVINNENEIAGETFRLKELTEELVKLPLSARIIVLDAARDHQIGSAGGKPTANGLATSQVLPGMLIAFAATPGAIAVDGDADYSLFTGTLVTQMRQPGLDLEQMLRNTRIEVNNATAGRQAPWTRSALHAGLRLFDAPDQQANEAAAAPKQPRKRRSNGSDPIRAMRQILRHGLF